jgi:hypothetical protein
MGELIKLKCTAKDNFTVEYGKEYDGFISEDGKWFKITDELGELVKVPIELFTPEVENVHLKVKSIFYNGRNRDDVMKLIGRETPMNDSTFSVHNVYFVINEYLGNYWVLSEADYRIMIK